MKGRGWVTHDNGMIWGINYQIPNALVVLLSQAKLSLPQKQAKFWNILEPPTSIILLLRSILPFLSYTLRLHAILVFNDTVKQNGRDALENIESRSILVFYKNNRVELKNNRIIGIRVVLTSSRKTLIKDLKKEIIDSNPLVLYVLSVFLYFDF